jgi:hypothetical protein
MDDKCIFNCEVCGTKIETAASQTKAPECCNKPMQKAEPLPACELSSTAEHSRMDDFGEPCDDGRAGKV